MAWRRSCGGHATGAPSAPRCSSPSRLPAVRSTHPPHLPGGHHPMTTDAAGALAPTDHLTPFDGRQVLRTSIAVSNAGDGLSEALRIDPREFHHGEVVH